VAPAKLPPVTARGPATKSKTIPRKKGGNRIGSPLKLTTEKQRPIINIFLNNQTEENEQVPPRNFKKTKGAAEKPNEEEDNHRKEFLRKNFITLRGKSYSKKYFVQLKGYFESIDEFEKGFITIDDYVQACKKEPALKDISISLFQYFDKKSCGSITFIDMCRAMVPGLQPRHFKLILKWVGLEHIHHEEGGYSLSKADPKKKKREAGPATGETQ